MNRNDQAFIAQKIRTQYTEKEISQLDELRELDSKVKSPAITFAYIFGSIAAIIMGAGMSLVMTDFGQILGSYSNMSTPIGIIIGIVGMILAILNYPIYSGILGARKKKYASKIIELSEKIMNNK